MRSRATAPRPRRGRPDRRHYRPIPAAAAPSGPITLLGSISHVYGIPSATELNVPVGVVGNARLLIVRNYHHAATVTALTGGGPPSSGTGLWARIAGSTTDADGSVREIWLGRINSTASTQIVPTYSATPTGLTELISVQLASTAGTSATWGRVGTEQGTLNTTTSSATPLLPALTATATGQAYVGHICVGGTASAGTNTGFTYYTGPNSNLVPINPHVTAGVVQPGINQSPASTAQAIAVLVTDGT